MTLRALAFASVLVLTALAGCSGSDPDSSTTTGTETTATTTGAGGTTSTVTQTQTQTTTKSVTTTVTGSSSSTSTSTGPVQPPSPPPVLDLVAVTGITANGATITWNVTDDQDGVQSRVEYGADPPASFSLRSAVHLGSGDKAQPLTDLASCTDYKFRVMAADPSGNSVTSAPLGFRTATVALGISGVAVTAVSHDRFTVSWTVAGPADAKSHVEYGLTTALDTATPEITGTGAKSVTLAGLDANKDYHYRIFLTSPCNNASTTDATQKTGVLLEVSIENNGGGINSFDPGSTLYGAMEVPKDRPITFKITNNDAVTHSWLIEGKAHSSSNIIAGATYTFPAAISLPAGSYTMKCGIHPSMTGTITAA
ncbi:MAG: hypothetical protein QOD77_2054 [Thermoplasmata archaeon]|jgi:heme/copper-type cytochrome/quinol oxidase subunit 2|nr:hypothetical protein [Thermoplasmata archaeon]